jgi:hypothetical protein
LSKTSESLQDYCLPNFFPVGVGLTTSYVAFSYQ